MVHKRKFNVIDLNTPTHFMLEGINTNLYCTIRILSLTLSPPMTSKNSYTEIY